MNKKILFASLITISSLPITLISSATITTKNKNQNNKIIQKQDINNSKTKYVIRIDNKEMIFN